MPPNKPALLYFTYTGTASAAFQPSCSPSTSNSRHCTFRSKRLNNQLRSYSSNESPPWPAHRFPTPYQIFGHSPQAPYSKHRFYELVKLYHPDRCPSHLSSSTRVQFTSRYRLIVAANIILSDPARRRAYDSHGAGWDGIPDLRNDGTDGCQGGEWKHAGKGWRQRPDSPAYNATWEDWEKWYARRDRAERGESEAKQPYMFRGMGMANGRPIFASNAMAVSVLVLLAALAGVGQATRAKTSAERENDKRDMVHKGCNQFLSQKKHLKAGGKDECVSNFLSNRENTTFGFRDTSNKAETPATGEEQNTRFKSVGSQRG